MRRSRGCRHSVRRPERATARPAMPLPSHQGASARLAIRAAIDGQRTAARVQALLGRLRVRWGWAPHNAERAHAVIDIRDLQGCRVLELREVRPPLDLDLPSGTYHVSIDTGGQRRRYTIVLEAGTCFELPVHAPTRELAT